MTYKTIVIKDGPMSITEKFEDNMRGDYKAKYWIAETITKLLETTGGQFDRIVIERY